MMKKLESLEEVETWNCVDVLYFADSLGSMNTEDVSCVYNNIRDIGLEMLVFILIIILAKELQMFLKPKKLGVHGLMLHLLVWVVVLETLKQNTYYLS